MGGNITETGAATRARQWVSGLWRYYRQYTHSAIHAASAAALTIFGLLVFIDPLFAAVAIAAYVFPSIVLYVLGVDVGTEAEDEAVSTDRPLGSDSVPVTDPTRDSENAQKDDDSDSDDGDRDSDGADGDSDSDSDDGDSDSDSDDGDSDSDSDDGDSDSDGADGDSDSDGSDTDSDGVSVDS